MTNEEAREVLSTLNIAVAADATPILLKSQILEATSVAIKALDQTELEPCEDCISRKDVIILIDETTELHPYKVIGDSETYSDYNQGWEDACNWLYANIESDNLKNVTPQPKMGHWIDIMVGDMPAQACDRCNTFYPLSYTGGGHRYCPNCGAKMEVDNEK